MNPNRRRLIKLKSWDRLHPKQEGQQEDGVEFDIVVGDEPEEGIEFEIKVGEEPEEEEESQSEELPKKQKRKKRK